MSTSPNWGLFLLLPHSILHRSCASILNGLLSFMYDTNTPTTGSVTSSKQEKLRLAAESLAFNLKNPTFRKLFPERVEEHAQAVAARELLQQQEAEKEQKQQETKASAGAKVVDAKLHGMPGNGVKGGGTASVPGASDQPKLGVGADPGLPSGSVFFALVALLACIYFAVSHTSWL